MRELAAQGAGPGCLADAPEHARELDPPPERASGEGNPLATLLVVRRGRVTLVGPHGRWSIVAGHMVYIPAGRPCVLMGMGASSVRLVHLLPAGTDWPHPGCWVAPVLPIAAELVEVALRWGADRDPADDTANAVFRVIARLCPDWFASRRILWTPFVESPALREAVRYACTHLDSTSVEQAAAAARLSPRTLRRRVQDELGSSWRDLVREIRMTRAIELLSGQGLSVTATALSTGFSSVAAFSAAFTSYTGRSPRAFLRLARACSLRAESGIQLNRWRDRSGG